MENGDVITPDMNIYTDLRNHHIDIWWRMIEAIHSYPPNYVENNEERLRHERDDEFLDDTGTKWAGNDLSPSFVIKDIDKLLRWRMEK